MTRMSQRSEGPRIAGGRKQAAIDRFHGAFLGALLAVWALSSSAPALAQTAEGPRFQINSATTGQQSNPKIEAHDSGLVVVWDDPSSGVVKHIKVQRLDFDGQAVGSELQASTYTTSSSDVPDVATAPDGSFLVVWSGPGNGDNGSVQGRAYDSSGAPIGSQFRVNSYTSQNQNQARIARNSSGTFVVTWQSYRQDGDYFGVYGQAVDSAGTKLGGEFRVNTYTQGYQFGPAISAAPDGTFVVAWTENNSSFGGSAYDVAARRLDSSGQPVGTPFLVNTVTTFDQTRPEISHAADGSFVVVWRNTYDDPSDGVRARRFDSSGSALGADFQVNSYTTSIQANPAIDHDTDGSFLITWSGLGTGGDFDVWAQRFASDGARAGAEFKLTDDTGGSRPDLAYFDTGTLLAAWLETDGDNLGVFGRLFCTDSDDDGVCDDADLCPGFDDTDDNDADTVPDDCDACPGSDDLADSDADGVPDGCDVCAGGDDGVDTDADGVPDFCDLCAGSDDTMDADADGVPNGCDACSGFDDTADADSDGVADGCDQCAGFDDATDSDSDGTADGCDQCAGFDDAADGDGDGVPDGCDDCAGNDASGDSDGDGLCDDSDACFGNNATGDSDGDQVCDDQDICAGAVDALDADLDGVPDGCDTCPGFPDGSDSDADGVPDGCDVCAGSPDGSDADGDGVPDGCDVCAGSPDDSDADGDGVPDGCDVCAGADDAVDGDRDGVPDGCDQCLGTDAVGDSDLDGLCDDYILFDGFESGDLGSWTSFSPLPFAPDATPEEGFAAGALRLLRELIGGRGER